jgi:hypothetical protein
MNKQVFFYYLIFASISIFNFSCSKDSFQRQTTGAKNQANASTNASTNAATPPFNLEVILRGEGTSIGHVKFRQDVADDKIVRLDTWVHHLEPNHEYLLQRAVDAINVVDGDCASTTWLTLGSGLTPQSIITDGNGTANVALWRSVAAVPTGSAFDIHFQVVDATTMAVVLTSDCYEYVVR